MMRTLSGTKNILKNYTWLWYTKMGSVHLTNSVKWLKSRLISTGIALPSLEMNVKETQIQSI